MIGRFDQRRPGGRPEDVRCGDEAAGRGGRTAQQRVGGLALYGGERGDQHTGQAHTARRETVLAAAAQGGAGDQPDRYGTGALDGGSDTGVRGGVPEAADAGVAQRPADTGAAHGRAAGQDEGRSREWAHRWRAPSAVRARRSPAQAGGAGADPAASAAGAFRVHLPVGARSPAQGGADVVGHALEGRRA
ncbi:hypothetical protein OHB06_13525 [Streptomyces sp. NBC_01604]